MNIKNILIRIFIGLMVFGIISAVPFTLQTQAATQQNMTQVLDLDGLIKEVLNNNPELKLLDNQIQVQEKRYKIAIQKADQERVRVGIPDAELAQNKMYVLLYPLQAKNKLDDLKWQKENKLVSLQAEASKLYYQYIFKQHEVEAQSKAVERARAELKIVNEKIKLGKLSSLSLPQNENAVDLSNQKLTKLNTELASIIMRINSLLNYDLDQKPQVSSETTNIEEYTVKNIEVLIEKRKLESNSIKELQANIEEAKIEYYVESYNRQSIASNYEQLEDKPKELENNIENEKYKIEQKIRNDYNSILNLYDDIAIAKLSYDLNLKLFDVAGKKYKQEMISYVEYLKAAEDRENAMIQYDQAQLAYHTAVLDFKLYTEQLV